MGVGRKSEVLRLVVESIGDQAVHYGPAALVGDLVEALDRSADGQSLRVERTGQVLSPDLKLAAAGLRTGDRVSLVDMARAAHLPVDQQLNSATATLEMLSGPLRGSLYSLPSGTSTIGRVAANDLVIVDPGISRQHAIVTVDETSITIVDNGSTNGIKVDGEPIAEATQIESGKPILVGQSLMAITHHGPLAAAATVGSVELARSDRTIHRFDEQVITLPVPPDAVTKRRRTELLSSGRSRHRLAVEHFHASVAAIKRRLEEGQQNEISSRFYEAPSITEIRSGAASLWRLWERRALDPDGLEVRLGIGTMPSRTDLRLPDGGDPELRSRVSQIPEQHRLIPNLPAVVDFRRYGSIGLSGPQEPVDRLAYSMIVQLAWFHGPDQLGLACASGSDPDSWDWLKWLPHMTYSDGGDLDADTGLVRWLSAILDGTPTSFVDPLTAAQSSGSMAEPESGPRPPAIVVVLDRGHRLSGALLTRLLQDGPALGVYTLVLWGDQPESGTSLGAEVSVGVESANIDTGSGEHLGGIVVESMDSEGANELARLLSPLRYGEQATADDSGADDPGVDSAAPDEEPHEGVVVAPFRLIGTAAPALDVAEPAVEADEPEVEPEPQPQRFEPEPADPDSDPNAAFMIDPAFIAASPADPEPDADPEPEVDSEPVAGDEPESGPETETGAEAETEIETGAEAGPESEVGSDESAGPGVPAAPTMPQRPGKPSPPPHRLIQTLPHSNDPGRLMLGTIHTDDRSAPAVFAWNTARDGSLGIIGGAGAGKTSALRSVVASAALLRVESAQVPLIYYLDVRGQLESIGALPNCTGAIRNDIDGFRSMAATLENELDTRSATDQDSGGVSGGASGEESKPENTDLQDGRRRALVVIDEVGAFVELMDSLEPGQAGALLRRLVEDGPALGMNLVLSAASRDELPEVVASSIGRWLTIGTTPRPDGSDSQDVGDSDDAGDSQHAGDSEDAGETGPLDPGVARIGKNEIRFAPVAAADADRDIIDAALSALADQLIERGVTGPVID